MKKALPLAMIVLITAGFFVQWKLDAEVDELRQFDSHARAKLRHLEGTNSALQAQIAQATAAHKKAELTFSSTNAPGIVSTNSVLATGRSLAERRALEKEVEDVRGLKFLKPVAYRTMASTELKAFLGNKLREEYSSAEMRDYARALAMIGLVPEDVDFEATIMEVMGEQVAAFYDQDTAQLYTFSDSPLTGNMDRMIVAHEMTHALQDQHFHIKKWPLKRKDNDDMVAGHMALLEGDATVTMSKVLLQRINWKTALADVAGALMQNTEKFMRAPGYFRELLLFPYQRGQEFVTYLLGYGGQALLNKAFENPPTSTAQVLHPEKFNPKREEPLAVEPVVTAEPGWRRLSRNVVGELGIIVLLREFGHSKHASSVGVQWRGDRYVAFDDGKGLGILYWRSTWATQAAAKQFSDICTDIVLKRNSLRQPPLVLKTMVVDCTVDLTLHVPPAKGEKNKN